MQLHYFIYIWHLNYVNIYLMSACLFVSYELTNIVYFHGLCNNNENLNIHSRLTSFGKWCLSLKKQKTNKQTNKTKQKNKTKTKNKQTKKQTKIKTKTKNKNKAKTKKRKEKFGEPLNRRRWYDLSLYPFQDTCSLRGLWLDLVN